jgi:hypothetical protein
MPPPPLFKSSRIQTAAVAVVMGLFLLGAAGLAKLQAGSGPAYMNTPINREYKMPQSEQTGPRYAVLIDTPANWQTTDSEPGRFVAIDPEKTNRSITLITAYANEVATPTQAARLFFERQLDPSVRKTFRPVTEAPQEFVLNASGLQGAQFIGTSDSDGGTKRQHLLAVMTLDGRDFWWVYLVDTIDAGEDELVAMRMNVWLLQSVYRSARIVQE